MKSLMKFLMVLLLVLPKNGHLMAQEYYNTYKAVEAVMLQTDGTQKTVRVLNSAMIVLPNNSDKLEVFLNIPTDFRDSAFGSDTSQMMSPMELSFDIDRIAIQQNLTSSATFFGHALLSLNGIRKWITVMYTPIASGTEEDGNFHISMVIQFDATDFNIGLPGNKNHLQFTIANARVNIV